MQVISVGRWGMNGLEVTIRKRGPMISSYFRCIREDLRRPCLYEIYIIAPLKRPRIYMREIASYAVWYFSNCNQQMRWQLRMHICAILL